MILCLWKSLAVFLTVSLEDRADPGFIRFMYVSVQCNTHFSTSALSEQDSFILLDNKLLTHSFSLMAHTFSSINVNIMKMKALCFPEQYALFFLMPSW